MNRNWLWLIVAAMAVASILTTMFAQAEQTQNQAQWEYKDVRMPSRSTNSDEHNRTWAEATLNELGKDGWEVVVWEEFNCLLKRQVAN